MQQSVDRAERFATVEDFLAAYEGREGRYELVDGVVVKMPAETLPHVRVKTRITYLLFAAVEAAGADAEVLADGISLKVGPSRSRGPDVSIILDRDADLPERTMLVHKPVVLVEVLSPTSGRIDRVQKLVEYFTFPTLAHYLVVDPVAETVTRHRRAPDGSIAATSLSAGLLALDPPGIVVDVSAFWPAAQRRG